MANGSAPEALDETGKADFNSIYISDDPRKYYVLLGRNGYLIPEAALGVFRSVYAAYRAQRAAHRLQIVDVGCSYGVNGALQKFGICLSELEARYAAFSADGLSAAEVLDRDRRWLRGRPLMDDLVVTGLDSSLPAIDYAVRSGLLDSGFSLDFEAGDAMPEFCLGLGGTDLIISTGAVGYVTETTFAALADAAEGQPWIALFCLRQFSIVPIAEALAERGYAHETLDGRLFPQRRFTGPAERDGALARLAELGRSPTSLEEQGWYAAGFHLFRPKAEAQDAPLTGLVDPDALPAAAA